MQNTVPETLLLCIFCCIAMPCSSDQDNLAPTCHAREIKYEITGDFSAPVTLAYTSQLGTPGTFRVSSLPLTLQFIIAESATDIRLSVNGKSIGQAGKMVTAKIFQGGAQKQAGTATADANGLFTLNLHTAAV